jgi:hypothetical protein
MTETTVRNNLSTLAGRIAVVLMEPYKTFIARLHSEGRVTDAELEELRQAFAEVLDHLGEKVQVEVREDDPRDAE